MAHKTVTDRLRVTLRTLCGKKWGTAADLARYAQRKGGSKLTVKKISYFLTDTPDRKGAIGLDHLDDIAGFFGLPLGTLLGAMSADELSADEQRLVLAYRTQPASSRLLLLRFADPHVTGTNGHAALSDEHLQALAPVSDKHLRGEKKPLSDGIQSAINGVSQSLDRAPTAPLLVVGDFDPATGAGGTPIRARLLAIAQDLIALAEPGGSGAAVAPGHHARERSERR